MPATYVCCEERIKGEVPGNLQGLCQHSSVIVFFPDVFQEPKAVLG